MSGKSCSENIFSISEIDLDLVYIPKKSSENRYKLPFRVRRVTGTLRLVTSLVLIQCGGVHRGLQRGRSILVINIADTILNNRLLRGYDNGADAWGLAGLGCTSSTCTRSRTTTHASPRLPMSARPWLRRAWHPATRLLRAPWWRSSS
eukprot:5693044-Pleurochrysis_carterae.AAC.1